MTTAAENFHIRRLYPAPDDASQVLATSDRGAVPLLHVRVPSAAGDDHAEAVRLVPDTDDTPRVWLPFPATDLAWCPFKNGDDNASFITSCQSQPMQLWDVADGGLRGAYVAHNDSGMNAHARGVLWLVNPFQNLIAGAYGGVEDATQVRFFDVAVEGDQCVFGYRSPSVKGPVSALGQCAPLRSDWNPPPSLLVFAGFLHHHEVDCIDYRQRCAAAILRGPQSDSRSGAISCIRTTPREPNLVFAAGRGGSGTQSDILCWDLRRPGSVLAAFSRQVTTQQQCDFSLLPHPSDSGVRLVSATTDGGVVVFDDTAVSGRVVGRTVHQGAGITSGLAPVSDTAVVVAVGARTYRFDARERPGQGSQTATAPTATDAAAEKDDNDDDDRKAALSILHRKRSRPMAALSDGSGDDEPAAEAGLNVAVLSIS